MANNNIPLHISENQVSVSLRVNGRSLLRSIEPDNGSPYYVGARAYVTQTENGATITIIDKDGTTTATVTNGADGQDGADGADGADGFSPSATVSKVGDTATISITDENGTTTATVSDGADGQDGQDGRDGTDGTDGQDGVGIVSIIKTATVGLVDTYTITYTDGTTSTFEVTNGQNGSGSVADVWVDGSSVLDGDTAKIDLTGKADVGDIPTKVSDLTNDAGYITGYTETDPVFSASVAHGISSSDISNWNDKSDFSGDYDDLTNKPNMVDYVTEQGTSGVWTYRKWNSGISECWGAHKYTLTAWSSWGTLYEGSSSGGAYYRESYPNNLFVARPFSVAAVQGTNKGYLLETYTEGDATKTDGYIVVRPNNTGSLVDVYINIHSIGRWK